MSEYPIKLIKKYKEGKITLQQYKKQFGDWQKKRGMNFDCKGGEKLGYIQITYRGVTATYNGGALYFITDTEHERAASVFEFRRKVDFSICKRLRNIE